MELAAMADGREIRPAKTYVAVEDSTRDQCRSMPIRAGATGRRARKLALTTQFHVR
jgi:hypothetical protein